ncbi:Protein FAM98A [Anabarilius grahami]|uniref:Protein FAM98A n=1 Tax=Anabarilius grahami TaxID=495550 RepID=A0A3N0XVY9_ANAGA|nr:Protein FAM98A [Anabarilius grahami]
MEFTDVLDSLEDLGYQGPLLEDGALETAVTGGAASPEFTKLCAWLVSELKLYCKLEENVHATNCPSEGEGFQLEMSGLLSEIYCPYPALTTGEVTKRLLNANNCLLLLGFLISELESSRMTLVNHPQNKVQESSVFIELKGICMALGMSKPPANITMFQFFSGIEKKLKEALSKVPPSHIGEPLLKKPLGPVHWEKIEAINQALVNEYEVRRKMLLKRLDVTVQSFGWSERAKTRADKLSKVYQPLRVALATKTRVSVAHLFAAREDLSKILRTSSGHIREKTACAINKEGDLMRSNPHLRRCLRGRNGKMVHKGAEEDSTTPVVEEEEVVDEVVMISSRAAAVVMTEEVEAAEVREETTVVIKLRGTGRMALAEADTRVITRIADIEAVMEEGVATMEASRGRDTKEEATKEASKDRGTKEASKDRGTKEEATKAEVGVSSMRATIRMEDDPRREVEGVVVGVEGGEEEVGREEDGVEEEGRILTKVGSLSSSFSKVGTSITRPALAREDSLLAEKRRLLRSTASKKTHNSLRVGD